MPTRDTELPPWLRPGAKLIKLFTNEELAGLPIGARPDFVGLGGNFFTHRMLGPFTIIEEVTEENTAHWSEQCISAVPVGLWIIEIPEEVPVYLNWPRFWSADVPGLHQQFTPHLTEDEQKKTVDASN